MAKVDVLSLVAELSQGAADVTLTQTYYTDAINTLSNRGFFTETRILDRNEDGVTYTKDDDMNRILEIFFGDTALSVAGIQDLLAFQSNWREKVGQPFAFTYQSEDAGTFRLYPTPTTEAGPNSFITGAPDGEDLPNYAVLTICTTRRENVQDWLDLPIALMILAKEFNRESNHTDKKFAALADQLAQTLLEVI